MGNLLLNQVITMAVPTLQDVLSPIITAVVAGGGLWAVWGAIKLGLSLHNHSGGNDIRDAIFQIVGGIIIGVAAGLFKQFSL